MLSGLLWYFQLGECLFGLRCSAIYRSHDHVDGAKHGPDVGHLVSLKDVGKDLEVVAIRSPALEA